MKESKEACGTSTAAQAGYHHVTPWRVAWHSLKCQVGIGAMKLTRGIHICIFCFVLFQGHTWGDLKVIPDLLGDRKVLGIKYSSATYKASSVCTESFEQSLRSQDLHQFFNKLLYFEMSFLFSLPSKPDQKKKRINFSYFVAKSSSRGQDTYQRTAKRGYEESTRVRGMPRHKSSG